MQLRRNPAEKSLPGLDFADDESPARIGLQQPGLNEPSIIAGGFHDLASTLALLYLPARLIIAELLA